MFTDDVLEAMRERTDPLADEVANQLLSQISRSQASELMQWLANPSVLQAPEFFKEIWQKYMAKFLEHPPAWADVGLMQKGSLFFKKYQEQIIFLLGTLSLPYCYAGAKGVQVLYLSQRIQNDTYKRLRETAVFVLEAMKPEQAGWVERLLKVRLLHSIIRHYTLKNAQWNPSWNQPINQEDMAGTNLSFSYIIIKGLRKQQIPVPAQEAEAYLHLWNVIGYWLGIEQPLLPTNLQQAYWLDKKIAQRQFAYTEEGVALTHALLRVFEEYSPTAAFKALGATQMRFMLGDKLADMLKVPPYNATSLLMGPLQVSNWIKSWF